MRSIPMYADKVLFPGLRDFLSRQASMAGKIFLVGGSIRDAQLGLSTPDLDFMVFQAAPNIAKRTADTFRGAYYMLNAERNTARAIIHHKRTQFTLDFAEMRESSIEDDLAARDFTINAMAVDLSKPDELVDPLGGREDLEAGVLRPCRVDSFRMDPIRTLRAVRFITGFHLKIEESTAALIRESAGKIHTSSSERIRDELFKILETTDIATALDLLRSFGLFNILFPELVNLSAILPGEPHHHDVLTHTFRVAEYIQKLLAALKEDRYTGGDQRISKAIEALGNYSDPLIQETQAKLNPQRTKLGLLYLAALYHDCGKLLERKDGEIREISGRDRHARFSADVFRTVSKKFALSNVETDYIVRIIQNHMREELKTSALPADYAVHIYSFFRAAGLAGVLLVIFHLADLLATYENDLEAERWQIALKSSTRLLEGWFKQHHEWISPSLPVNGDDLMVEFNLQPGEQIGETLEAIRQAIVRGEVSDRSSALAYASEFLRRGIHG